MFDITGKARRQATHQLLMREMDVLDAIIEKRVRPILNRYFIDAAKQISLSGSTDVTYIVSAQRRRFQRVLRDHYKRVANRFLKITKNSMNESGFKGVDKWEQKTIQEDDFWRTMDRWTVREAAKKVTKMDKSSKHILARVIRAGQDEGESTQEIAKRLRKTGLITSRHRARTIARTETHNAALKATDESVKSSGMDIKEKEWSTTKDDRARGDHRIADGQKVKMEDDFLVGGEKLSFPGDPKGSAANVINCRCVVLYSTKAITVPEAEQTPLQEGFVAETDPINYQDYTSFSGPNRNAFADSFNIGDFTLDGYTKPADKLKLMNATGRALGQTLDILPELRDKVLKKGAVRLGDLEIVNTKFLDGEIGVTGTYHQRSKLLTVAGKTNKVNRLSIGKKHSVGSDFNTTVRHEYGHFIEMSFFDKDDRARWADLYRKLTVQDKGKYFKKVSVYANQDAREAFAESFAAYSSPLYESGVIGKTLPKELEEYFEEVVGKRIQP